MYKIILYNIEYCENIDGKLVNYLKFWKYFYSLDIVSENIAKELKKYNADIIGLVEVDKGSWRRKKKNDIVYLKNYLGMNNYVSNVKYCFNSWFKVLKYIPILNKQSNAILSKKGFSQINYYYFEKGMKKLIIEVTLNLEKKIKVILVHLALNYKTRQFQINELIKIVNNSKEEVILMGDFNTFKGLGEIKQLLKETNLFYFPTKKIYTQPTFKPKNTLDYVLVSKNIKIKEYKTLNIKYSDHLPLFVEFEV